MIRAQFALLHRELWEHRSIYVVPIVVAVLMTLASWTGQVTVDGMEHIDFGIVGASNMPENARAVILSGIMIGLFFWGRKAPLPAIITALCVYLVVIVVNAVIDPSTIVQGIVLKVFFFLAMIAGIKAALVEQAMQRSLQAP